MTDEQNSEVRTIFLSDIHLGTRYCHADQLLKFLQKTRCDQLFLIGDIIDFTSMGAKAHWPASHGKVLKAIIKMANSGVQVRIIPGNHDSALRQFRHWQHHNISIHHEYVFHARDGRRYWLLHGDRFDRQCSSAPYLEFIGDMLNEVLMSLQFAMNKRRAKNSRASTRFLRRIKDNLAPAIRYINRFRETAIAAAKFKAFDGIMCGHIHYPQNVFFDNIHYLNTGDWVENCSAIVERMNGQLYLIENADIPLEISNQVTALSPTLIGRFPVITKQ